jgi:hypothetical protein
LFLYFLGKREKFSIHLILFIMNKNQVRKLNMFMVVWQYLESLPQIIVDLMPHFPDYLDEYRQRVLLLQEQYTMQLTNTSAYRSIKISDREVMVNGVVRLITNVLAYVDFEENVVLRDSVLYSKSTLMRLPEQVCATVCMQLHDIGYTHLIALGPYGETEATIGELKALVLVYKTGIPSSKNKTDVRVMATGELLVEFKAVDEVLWKITRAFRRLSIDYSKDFKLFMASRKLIGAITVTLAIKGIVVDEMGIGVAKVKIVVQDYPRRQIKRTSDYGRFQFKNFEDGEYILTFSRFGYITQQVTVYVTKGIRTEVRVVLLSLTASVLETE